MEKIKQVLIEAIKKKGFPVAFMVQWMDGGLGYIIRSENKIEPLGYA